MNSSIGCVHHQRLEANSLLPRHLHRGGYAAIVLRGAYREAGDGGRRMARAGTVLVHEPFTAHSNLIGAKGVEVTNVPLTIWESLGLASGVIDDPERLIALGGDRVSSLEAMRASISPGPAESDLADRLAADLDAGMDGELKVWANNAGLSPRTVLRQFRRLYGVTPAHYRWRANSRRAWRELVTQPDVALAEVAARCGFSDQAHMARSVRQLTGMTPRAWRSRPMSV
jgi:AraC-like DNA-binding protein